MLWCSLPCLLTGLVNGLSCFFFVVRRMKKRKRRVWKRTFADSSVLWERVEVERIRPPAKWVTAPRLPRVGWRDVCSVIDWERLDCRDGVGQLTSTLLVRVLVR